MFYSFRKGFIMMIMMTMTMYVTMENRENGQEKKKGALQNADTNREGENHRIIFQ